MKEDKTFFESLNKVYDLWVLINKNGEFVKGHSKIKKIGSRLDSIENHYDNILDTFSSLFGSKFVESLTHNLKNRHSQSFSLEWEDVFPTKYFNVNQINISDLQTLLLFKKVDKKEESYRLITENVHDLISVINERLRYEYINEERHKKILGYSKEDMIGKSSLHFIHPEDRKESFHALKSGRDVGKGATELRFQHKNGHYVWLEVKGRGFVDKNGDFKGYMIARDITVRKKAEKKIKGLMDELERRVKDRTIKLEKSEEKYRMAYDRATCYKGLFTHDINNMFHAISNAIELYEIEEHNGINNKKLDETLELIKRQIDRGTKLIENIQNLSEIEQSEMKLEPIEVNKTIRNAIEFIKNNFKNRKIEVSLNTFKSKIFVKANELLTDVFENVLINSIRYTRAQKVRIDIEISQIKRKKMNYIKIEFKDNGIGIPDSQKELIFEEKIPKPNSKGMGLGLSWVSKLLSLCDGNIMVKNRIKEDFSKGSNFIVKIPKIEINQIKQS